MTADGSPWFDYNRLYRSWMLGWTRLPASSEVANVSYELPATVESMCPAIDVGPGVKL